MAIFKPKKIDITQQGLAKILGSLEAKIVEYIWSQNKVTARQVCDHISNQQKISFNAVNTVIGRLIDKGILCRNRLDGCWQYQACYTKDKLYQMTAQSLVRSLVNDRKLMGVATFMEAFDGLSVKEKADLKKLLKQ